jgi:hypothetical protein
MDTKSHLSGDVDGLTLTSLPFISQALLEFGTGEPEIGKEQRPQRATDSNGKNLVAHKPSILNWDQLIVL